MQESAELRELIISSFDALTNGDLDWIDRHVVCGPELRLIGTDTGEWLRGVEGFDLLRQQAANGRGGIRAEVDYVEAYSSGDVGWGAVSIRYTNEAGETALGRETVVFHRFDQTWKLVTAHTSLPVSGDEAFRSRIAEQS
jgi:hypothetical protein